MSKTHISAAGNVLAPALAEVRAAGYEVKVSAESGEWQAIGTQVQLNADDPLGLLGLLRLFEARGLNWRPTDEEVEAMLSLDSEENSGAQAVPEAELVATVARMEQHLLSLMNPRVQALMQLYLRLRQRFELDLAASSRDIALAKASALMLVQAAAGADNAA